ncbi:MAG: 2-oxo acid dehydrogenase subunit E2 [Deltaproteobacteria bacterium]|nr:2-oxo acid dehydrogenase subunit E2 [Deltaproteobacteria bacterium]
MDIRVPRLAEGVDSATVVNILVSQGDQIQQDQTIMELETEKAVGPIPSPGSGTVAKIHVKEGDKVTVGQLLISLSEANAQKATAAEKPAAAKRPAILRPPEAEAPSAEAYRYESKSGYPPPASLSLRKMAGQLGIDLTRVKGSEKGGRIALEDVRAYIQRLQQLAFEGAAAPERPAPKSIDFSRWGPVKQTPMSALRRTVDEKMVESWTSIPHVTQFDEADISSLLALRKKYSPLYEKTGARLTLTSFALKAVVTALKKFPIFNSSVDEAAQQIIYKEYFHIGVAVDTESGLIVPVLRDVDKKNLMELSLELSTLAEKSRQRKISLEELQGGTFTISNLGGIGGAHFTPIIYKPQVSVIAMGRGLAKPVVRGERVEIRTMLPLGLSYDHRVIDGADGARFIRELVVALENFPEEALKP